MFLARMAVIVSITSFIMECLVGGRLIWLAVMEIVHPEPDSNIVQIINRSLLRFLHAGILLSPLASVCNEAFRKCCYFHKCCHHQHSLAKTISLRLLLPLPPQTMDRCQSLLIPLVIIFKWYYVILRFLY